MCTVAGQQGLAVTFLELDGDEYQLYDTCEPLHWCLLVVPVPQHNYGKYLVGEFCLIPQQWLKLYPIDHWLETACSEDPNVHMSDRVFLLHPTTDKHNQLK